MMFRKKHAVVIGVDRYGNGITPLQTAVADARAVAAALASDHGYHDPILVLDDEASLQRVAEIFEDTLPMVVDADDAVIVYFAGHGVALEGGGDPRGFLFPHDARPRDETTWLSMSRLNQALARLPCRHLMVVLDCCFAGAFRWDTGRGLALPGQPLFDSQFERFVQGTAWHVLTSASYDEEALDVEPGARNTRDGREYGTHSPFASALLRGLSGEADSSRVGRDPDGVITATELYQYIYDALVPLGTRSRQTPGLWPLSRENRGEFVFAVPGVARRTEPDPPLDDGNNPWLGLRAYGREDAGLLYGRTRVIEQIVDLIEAPEPRLVSVVGASGTGKSSVVLGGVLPAVEGSAAPDDSAWDVVLMPRLGAEPDVQLGALGDKIRGSSGKMLLVIDQFEELFTQCPTEDRRSAFTHLLGDLLSENDHLKVILTLRSDFEPRLVASEHLVPFLTAGRYVLPPLSSGELREVILLPARRRAIYFEPAQLVDELIDEVTSMPGALPLLSFALSEMYREARLRRRTDGSMDRELTRADYQACGRVVGALHRRANALVDEVERDEQETVRRVFLRMVSEQGGRLARRRVAGREFLFSDPAEQSRVSRTLQRYVAARLVVADDDTYEPAHDTLVLAWDRLLGWLHTSGSQGIMRRVWQSAIAWDEAGRPDGALWHQNPALPQIEEHVPELNRIELDFVQASRRARAEEQRREEEQRRLLTEQRDKAEEAARVAEDARSAAEGEARRSRDAGRMAAVHRVDGDAVRTAALLGEVEDPDRTPGWVSAALTVLARPIAENLLIVGGFTGQTDPISDDGRWALQKLGRKVRRSSVLGHQPDVDIPVAGGIHRGALDRTGRLVAVACEDGTVHLFRIEGTDARPLGVIDHPATVQLEFSSDGRRLLISSESTPAVFAVPVSDAERLEEIIRWSFKGSVRLSRLSPDGTRVATVGSKMFGTAHLNAVGDDRSSRVLKGHQSDIDWIEFSPSGKHVMTRDLEGHLRVWTAMGDRMGGRGGTTTSVAVSLDDETLAFGSSDGRLQLGPLAARRDRELIPAEGSPVVAQRFTRDGQAHYSLTSDGVVRVQGVSHGAEPVVQRLDGGPFVDLKLLPDEERFVARTRAGEAQLWRVRPTRPTSRAHSPTISGGGFSADGAWVVTRHPGEGYLLWPTSGRGAPLQISADLGGLFFAFGSADLLVCGIEPDGDAYLAASFDLRVAQPRTFDIAQMMPFRLGEDGRLAFRESPDAEPDEDVGAIAGTFVGVGYRRPGTLTPSGWRVATVDRSSSVVCVRDESGAAITELEVPVGEGTFVSVTPAGNALVVQGEHLELWPLDGPSPIRFAQPDAQIVSATADPDLTQLIALDRDGVLWRWSSSAPETPQVLPGRYVALHSPDGRRLVTLSTKSELREWQESTTQVIQDRLRSASRFVLPISERVELLGEEVTTARERHDAERQRRAEFSGEAVSSLTSEARPLVLPVDHVFGGSSEAGAKHQATEQLKASKEAVGNRTGLSPVWNTIGFLRSIPSFLILLTVILGVVFVVSRVLWSIVRGTVGFAFGPGLIPLIVIVVVGVAWGVWRSKRVAAPPTAHELGESPASGNEAPDAQPALSQPDADDEEEDSTALEPYRRSGSTGWRHVPLALVASVAAAMLVGALHGGIQAAYIDTFSSSRPFVLPWEFLVAPAIFGALLVGFLIPVFLAVNLAKIRSGVLGALAGCLMVVPTVGATLFMMIRLETVQGAASIPLFWLGMEGPAVLLITWGTTTVVLLGVGAKFGWEFALEPFCERCGAWAAPVYTDLKVGEPEDVPLLSKRVREGRIEQLADLPVTHPERTLSVSLLSCPHCNRTGFLSVTCAQPSSSLRSETGDPNTLAKNLVLGARATSMAARLSDPSWRPD